MWLSLAFTSLQDSPQGVPGWYNLGLIAGIGIIFYFILLRPQIKQQKEHQNLVSNIKKGDKVITNGGIWGEVDNVETSVVRLKISDKTKIVVTRSAISGFQPKPGDANPTKTDKK